VRLSELRRVVEADGVTEIRSDARYIIAVPNNMMDPKILASADDVLTRAGVVNVVFMPSDWKIYEIERWEK